MEKKYDMMGFGEAMVRFTAPNNTRLEQASCLKLAISGAVAKANGSGFPETGILL